MVSGERKLRIGVAGLGRAFTVMLPTLMADPRVALVAAADPRAEARTRFAADFSAQTYDTAEGLCTDPAVEIVYVATPHQHHARMRSWRHGKRVLVEKPMALDARRVRRDDRGRASGGVHLNVGHSHSFDAPILRTRALIAGGVRRRAHDPGVRLHRLRLSPAPARGARHRAGRRRDLQPGRIRSTSCACSVAGGEERARRDRRGTRASDRRRLCGAVSLRQRRVRVAHLWGLRPLRLG